MPGLFSTLNLAGQSLSVQQMGTQVAGQNLANVNNPAYARQRLNLQTGITISTPIGQQGTGVVAVSIQQIRDAMLDGQIASGTSTGSSLGAQQTALQDMEAALGEQLSTSGTQGSIGTSSPNGLAQSLSNLFNAFQNVSTAPSSLAQRQTLIQTAQQIASQLNQVSAQLTSIHVSLDQSIQNDVGSANQDLTDIAALNKQIVIAESGGGTANDLRDLRQQKLEDLSKFANISTTAQPNGGIDVSIGGVAMVSGVKQTDSLQVSVVGGLSVITAQTAGATLNLTGGSIAGATTIRDGPLATLFNNVNNLASQLITQVNSIYSAGYDLNGNTGQPFFTGATAADIAVNGVVASDPSKFQAAGAPGAPGDNSVALALAQLGNRSSVALGGQTFSQNYSQTVAGLGQSLANVNDNIANNGTIMQMLNNQRASVSGVSIDEEMTSLMQFQKAYQASAELVSTVNSMLATVIAMKTV